MWGEAPVVLAKFTWKTMKRNDSRKRDVQKHDKCFDDKIELILLATVEDATWNSGLSTFRLFLIMQCNCTAIGLSSALKMNQWLGSGAAQPMAAKLARMGRASGYIVRAFPQGSSDFFSFSDDYKSFALRDSRPSLLNKPSQRIQTSLCSADSPFLSSPQRLLQLVHSVSLFRELLYKIANLFGVVANAVPFLSSPARRWQCLGTARTETELMGRNVTTAVTWVSPLLVRG